MLKDALYMFFCALPFLTCLWWAVTIAVDFFYYRKSKSAPVFLVFVCVSTLLYFCHFVHFSAAESSFVGIFDSIWIFCTLSVYPLFGVWVGRLALPKGKLFFSGRLDYLIAFLPGLLLSGISFWLLYLGKDQYGLLLVVKLVFALEVLAVLLLGIRSLRAFRQEVANYYSDTDGKELRPVAIMLTLFLTVSGFSMVFNIVGRNLFLNNLLLALPSSIFTILLYSICYIGHNPIFDIDDFEAELVPESVPEYLPEPSSEMQDRLLERICLLMEKEHIYRNHGLKISEVAAAVGSNRTYVSNCINKKLGKTFSDFVAAYRVREAISRMEADGEGQNLEKIGWDSGFSGRSQFYRSFKKETGLSPGQWKRKP